MLKQIYNFLLYHSDKRYALWVLAAVSFLEAFIFPIPPDALLIPMAVAVPRRAFTFAAICLLFSVLGGLVGYFIGAALYQEAGLPLLRFLGAQHHADSFFATYDKYGAWAVLVAGLSPFPYKVITILSGAAEFSILVFILSSIAGRGVRFFFLAWLLWKFGNSVQGFIESRLNLVVILLLCLAVGFLLMVRT